MGLWKVWAQGSSARADWACDVRASVGDAQQHHKPLLPLDRWDAAMFGAAALTLLLAAGSGVGGGAVLVPLYIFLGGFPTSHAVALSNVTVLGGAAANLLVNAWRRHPRLPAPLIQWDLILVMEPTTIVGALAGGYANGILPVWLVSLCMSLVLCALSWKLAARGVVTYRTETRAAARRKSFRAAASALFGVGSAERGLTKPLLATEESELRAGEVTDGGGGAVVVALAQPPLLTAASAAAPTLAAAAAAAGVPAVELRRLLARPRLPKAQIAALLALFGGVVASDTLKSQLPCGSAAYWTVVLSVVPAALGVALGARCHLLATMGQRAAAGDALAAAAHALSEVRWTRANTLVYPLACTVAGVLAGLFGIGGGVVKAPLMLEMGVSPEVAAATSATMVFFTAAAASLVYSHLGVVQADYAAAAATTALVLTLVGQAATIAAVRALGRRSLIVLLMAALMVTATCVAAVQAWHNVRAAVRSGNMWDWGSICGSELVGSLAP